MDSILGALQSWQAETLTKFGEAVSGLGSSFLSYALALAAIGTIAMALREMIKNVWNSRMRFNRKRVLEWTNDVPTFDELLLLSSGAYADPEALFDQPVEKMMGQVQSAVHLALDFPSLYPNLYKFITSIPQTASGAAAMAIKRDSKTWKTKFEAVHRVKQQRPGQSSAKDIGDAVDATAARTRINNLIARKLDAFQNDTQYDWERQNQRIAVIIGDAIFVIAGVVALRPNPLTPVGWVQLGTLLVLGVPAGVVAPFAKDLAGSLASFGK